MNQPKEMHKVVNTEARQTLSPKTECKLWVGAKTECKLWVGAM